VLYTKKAKLTAGLNLNVLKQAQAVVAVPALCEKHGICTATFYKWRSKFGGMDAISDGSDEGA